MTKCFFMRAVFMGSVMAGVSFANWANAQPVTKFYKGTSITMYVGSGVGGGFDNYARVFARHYRDHIPGHPSIIVKNMPGGAGLVAENYLYNSAPRDGSAFLASFNTVIPYPLYGDPNAKFDPRRLSWIGSIGKQTGTCLTWHTSPVKTIEQARKQQVRVGATGFGANPTIYPKLLNAMIGTKFKIVAGYTTPGMRQAVVNGEVQGVCGLAWETLMASTPSWILDKKVNFLVQLGLSKSTHLPKVPMAIDLIKNPADRRVFELLASPQEYGRPIVAPPGVPADRLAALRTAFATTMKDKSYLADAHKARQIVDPISGKQIESLIDRSYAAPKDIVARAAVYAKSW